MIRVGRRKYGGNTFTDPKYKDFTPILVLMNSHSKWGSLGPYLLTNEKGQIFENIWQFSKVYPKVPRSIQYYSRYDKTVIWDHPAEIHIDDEDNLTKEYFAWREKGRNNKYPVRYPVGFNHRHTCKFALKEDDIVPLNYIESRKEIYLKEYIEYVRKVPEFNELKQMLKTKNLLIIEVDGPHQESLPYYIEKYNVNNDFIEDDSILVTPENMEILLNDEKHPFGHGYCLAVALLDIVI